MPAERRTACTLLMIREKPGEQACAPKPLADYVFYRSSAQWSQTGAITSAPLCRVVATSSSPSCTRRRDVVAGRVLGRAEACMAGTLGAGAFSSSRRPAVDKKRTTSASLDFARKHASRRFRSRQRTRYGAPQPRRFSPLSRARGGNDGDELLAVAAANADKKPSPVASSRSRSEWWEWLRECLIVPVLATSRVV